MGTILIADSEENIRFSFESILAEDGYRVWTTPDLTGGESLLENTAFDVAIVDRLLGSENGMALIKKIRQRQPQCSIIIVSSYPTFSSAAEGMNYNTFAYLCKPVKKDLLRKTVKAAHFDSIEKHKCNKLERQIIQSQKLLSLGMISGGMIHDFNNLFMGIQAYSDMLLRKTDQSALNLKKLEHIKAISNKGSRLSTSLMAFLKDKNPEFETVDIRPVVREAVDLLEVMVPTSVRIETLFSAEPCFARIFPMQIEQSIINIGLNAMQAIGQTAGTIRIRIHPVSLNTNTRKKLDISQTDCIEIRIKDTGCGMDAETMKRIFTPFFTTRTQSMGTGIGLCVSEKYVKEHGGTIDVKSSPGKGSTFSIYLPAAQHEKEPSLEHQQAKEKNPTA